MPKLGELKTNPIVPNKDKNAVVSYITSSRKQGIDELKMLMHGPSGHGKTFTAATLSENWPGEEFFNTPIQEREWVTLEDILWIPFDDNALVGMNEQRIDVPHIDVAAIFANHTFLKGITIVQKCIKDYLAEHSPSILIADTISKLDKMIVEYWFDDANIPTSKGGNPDSMKAWQCVANTHQRFKSTLDLPMHVLYLCHTKPSANTEGDNPMARAALRKQTAGALPGFADKEIDITGKSAGIYRQDTSIIMPVVAKPQPKGKFLREVYTVTTNGFEAKNRFQASLNPKEPAHLGKMMKKIKAAMGDSNE